MNWCVCEAVVSQFDRNERWDRRIFQLYTIAITVQIRKLYFHTAWKLNKLIVVCLVRYPSKRISNYLVSTAQSTIKLVSKVWKT